jgi:hypothetical protein
MPPAAKEQKGSTIRMPKQTVRRGRGKAGYTGKVETYTPGRAGVQDFADTDSLAKARAAKAAKAQEKS